MLNLSFTNYFLYVGVPSLALIITISGFPSTYSVNTDSTCSYTGNGILTNKGQPSSLHSHSAKQSERIFCFFSQPRRSLYSTMCTMIRIS